MADQIYDLLVLHVGAPEGLRQQFVLSWDAMTEFRFMGTLGFGGKFWKKRDGYYISCYPEDETPGRLVLIQEANRLLRESFIK